jgi:PAS domain S-box-containing protein
MVKQYLTLYALFFLATSLVSFFVTFLAWQRRSEKGAKELAYLMFSAGVWSFLILLETNSATMVDKIFWSKLAYLGALSTPLFYLIFALRFTGKDKFISLRNILLLFVIPAIVLILTFTNEQHKLIWSGFSAISAETNMMEYYHGIGFWIGYVTYTYVLFFIATIYLFSFIFRHTKTLRLQGLIVFIGGLLPWTASIIYLSGNNPVPGLDLVPVSIILTGILFAYAVLYMNLLNLATIARMTLVETLSDGILALDGQNRIQDINLAALTYLGIQNNNNVIGLPFESAEITDRYIANAVLDPKPIIQTKVQTVDELKTFSINKQAIKDHAGSRLVIISDITKQIKAEERLSKLTNCLLGFGSDKNSNINSLVSLCGETMGATCVLYTKLENGKFFTQGQWQVPPGFHTLGTTDGHFIYDVIKRGSDDPLIIRNLQTTNYLHSDPNVSAYGLQTYIGIAVKYHKKAIGSLCAFYQDDVVIEQDLCDFLSIIGFAISIEVEHMHSENRLKASEQLQRSLLENVAFGIVIIDPETRIIERVNTYASQLIGETKENIVGRICHRFICPAHEFNCPVCDLKKEVDNSEKILVRFDHTEIPILKTVKRIQIAGKEKLMESFVDISLQKEAEKEMQLARIEAEKANLAKSEFLSRMSHELRTPMNSILGFAQLLEMGELNSSQNKGVKHILHSGKHLLDLINEVLDISRIESGHISLSLEPIRVSAVIQEIIDISMPLANRLQLKIDFEDAVDKSIFVKSDRQRLKQVLINLISNAVKYNKTDGSVSLKTELMPENGEGITPVRISVTDTGQGISAEDIPKLFIPFERIGADKSITEGSGLGLTVVKKIMGALGGTVGVESVLGVGSTFWFELLHVESPLENLNKNGNLTDLESNLNLNKGTILYIEDNESNIELVEQIISSHRSKINLITKIYGKQAVPSAIEYQPDLILLDLDLPDIHGSEVLKRLLAEEKTRDIPVIIISADAGPKQIEKLLKAGAQDYLTKPLDVMEFLKIIDTYIIIKMNRSIEKILI